VSIRNSPAFDELDHTAALRIITYHPEDGLGPPPTERAIGVACHGGMHLTRYNRLCREVASLSPKHHAMPQATQMI
jgi:hypothetical protein